MTTKGDTQGTKSALKRNGHAPLDDRRVGVSADPEVPDFISEILAQYKGLLVQHVETVKNKAVTEVKEEALLLHSQAELRLRSMILSGEAISTTYDSPSKRGGRTW